jgi:hypothetical protein
LETFDLEKVLAVTIGTVGLVLPFEPFIQFRMHPCSSISGTFMATPIVIFVQIVVIRYHVIDTIHGHIQT